MLLIARRLLLCIACAAAPLFLPACAVRRDDDYYRQNHSIAVKTGRGAGNPDAHPTAREQRGARALVRAMDKKHDEMNQMGATVMYRNDGVASKAHEVRFVAKPAALRLNVTASDMLNAVDGAPHAVTLLVYHLSDRSAVDALASTEVGMKKLLSGEAFDQSVRAVRRFDIQPGAKTTLVLDRPENGRYVALAAGYHMPDQATGYSVQAYPVSQFMQKVRTLLVKARVVMFAPEDLNMCVALGESSMSASPLPAGRDALLESEKMNPNAFAWSR